jgi:hypothetical protein
VLRRFGHRLPVRVRVIDFGGRLRLNRRHRDSPRFSAFTGE